MDISKLLASSSLFSSLSRTAIYRLAELAQLQAFQPGEVIIQQGQPAKGCFIIASGKAEVVKLADDRSHEVMITQLGVGDVIDEISIMDGRPHTVTVRAIEETKCLMIEQWDFKAQMQAYPDIALQLLPVLATRLRKVEHLG